MPNEEFVNPFEIDDEVVCPLCNTPVEQVNAVILDGVAFHRQCVADSMRSCHICGSDHYSGFSTRMNGHAICLECRNEVSQCYNCDGVFKTVDMHYLDGSYYCDDCWQQMAVCEECGERCLHSYNWHGRTLCEHCYNMVAPRGVCGYHAEPKHGIQFHSSGHDKFPRLFLGFELESGGTDEESANLCADEILDSFSDEERVFNLTSDTSIPRYGFELVSAPATLEWHSSFQWSEVFKKMVDYDLRSNDIEDCGLHVHFSRNALQPERCVLLDYFVMTNKHKFAKLARRTTHYARFDSYESNISDKIAVNREFEHKKRYRDRYYALNFTNDDTIEVRMFKGSLNYTTVMATLECVDALVGWLSSLREPTITHFENVKFSNWKAYVRRHNKRYANLIAYMNSRHV